LSLRLLLQMTHVDPPVPQVDRLLVWHAALSSQQPSAHEVPSQTHSPPTQACPAPQGACPPQVHTPAVHPSAVLVWHAVHVPPAVPQFDTDGTLHVVPAQQPFLHDVASQAHAPAVQCWPVVHAAHAAPPAPHVASDSGWHVVPEQHPLGHMHPLHTPAVHASPCGHASHAWPATPQLAGSVPASHVAPLQHPVGHD
jgi:hypothetical protein